MVTLYDFLDSGNGYKVRLTLRELEQQLARSDYLVAGSYSIADICLFAYVHRATEGGFDMGPHPAIAAWCRRIQSRPAFIPLDRAPE